MGSVSTIRWVLWGSLVALQGLVTARPPEVLAPAVGASVFAPLWVFHALGLPVYGRAESGGWSSPSVLGWVLVAVLWAAAWWGLVALVVRAWPLSRLLASR